MKTEPRMDGPGHLLKATTALAAGHLMLTGGFPDEAGRSAYMAAFHAALALIVVVTGKEPKTHNGTHSEFARVVRERSDISHDLVAFLSNTYQMTSVADYASADPVTPVEASAALETAKDFLSTITAIIAPPHPHSSQ